MARDRDSYIHRIGMTPNTMNVISSKNRIYASPADASGVEKQQVGVIATFDPSESRSIEVVRGIGYGDQIAELVPGVTEPMQISITRSAQYLSMVYQAFGYKGGVDGFVRSLKHHRWPFDIRQELVFSTLAKNWDGAIDDEQYLVTPSNSDAEGTKALITIYEACWIQDCSASYASDSALVQENVTMMVSDVLSEGGADYSDSGDSSDTGNNMSSIRFTGSTVNGGTRTLTN
jgi:hypothetical protein